jgi:hypothetical protein
MRKNAKTLFLGIISSLLAGVVLEILRISEIVVSWLPALHQILMDPTMRVVGISLLLFIPSSLVIKKIVDNQQEVREENIFRRKGTKTTVSEPDVTKCSGSLKKLGVTWMFEFGYDFAGDETAYKCFVDGPYCPSCGIKLDEEVSSRYLFLKKEVWSCPECQSEFKRRQEHLYKEIGVVKRLCKRDVLAVIDGEESPQYVENKEQYSEVEWG